MKKLSFFIFAIFCVGIVLALPFAAKNVEKFNKPAEKPTYSAIIEVWQLDMFEGGTGSRKNYLSKISEKFEKKNLYVKVSVSSLTPLSAEEKMKNGIYPDIISYSSGLDGVKGKMREIKIEDTFGGRYNKKTYALAWAVGGYLILTKSGEKCDTLIVSQGEFNQPLIAYYLSGLEYKNLVVKPQKEAYSAFIAQKNAALLGTQRDLYRLKNKDIQYKAQTISQFSDLVQYVSITSDEKIDESQKFVEFLVNNSQNLSSSIGMLEPRKKVNFDESNPLYALSGYQPTKTLSAFNSADGLKNLQEFLADGKASREEKLSRIKNILQ